MLTFPHHELRTTLRSGLDNELGYLKACPQQDDLRLSGPPLCLGARGGARTLDKRVIADLRMGSLPTVPPTRQMGIKRENGGRLTVLVYLLAARQEDALVGMKREGEKEEDKGGGETESEKRRERKRDTPRQTDMPTNKQTNKETGRLTLTLTGKRTDSQPYAK
ncbi:hypothetical protein PoB_002316800 [Plakobranchus ocellatus]|uniref:Uncharacterized protein n=1 Tax=Plakobranchus ocellatus TaxID=259542 RepID=A0AAV3ZPA2_9GAST|nr:hypothetical protein PoB_002316800 [Plakobranchus ocellatus]